MTCGKRAAIGRGQVRSADRLRIRRRCSANWPTRCLSSSVPASGFMRRAATSERSGCELSWRRARLGKACSRVHASSSPSVSCSSSAFASASRRSRFSRRSVSTLVWLRSTIRRTSSSSACCDASDTPAGTGPLAGLGSTVTGADPVAHSPSGRPSAARSPSAAGGPTPRRSRAAERISSVTRGSISSTCSSPLTMSSTENASGPRSSCVGWVGICSSAMPHLVERLLRREASWPEAERWKRSRGLPRKDPSYAAV
jgi:hypothetical protein